MGSISLKYKSKSGNLTAPGDVDPGAMIPIQTITVGAGGQSNVTFSSIPQNYEHLQIRFLAQTARNYAFDDTYVRLNGDTGSNYSNHKLTGDGSAVSAGGNASATYVYGPLLGSAGSLSSAFGVGVIDILDYTNTSKYKTVRILGGTDTNNVSTGSGIVSFISGLWMNTSAVTSIVIASASAVNINQYSHFALYGIKRAGA